MTFLHVLAAEWLKRKRSLASLMIVAGAFFTPAIVTFVRLLQHDRLAAIHASDKFWIAHWKSSWESMAIFFLPIGAILITSLVTQIEYRNNAWKQLHTLPVSLATIYFAKLLVILALMLQFLALFNAGIWLSAVIPAVVTDVRYPGTPLPWRTFLAADALYFVDMLPIVAAQYAISLRFRNFLVPLGAGFLAWVAALAALPWKFNYLVPYTYGILQYLKDGTRSKAILPTVNIHVYALAYFAAFTIAGFVLFATKRQKG